jgi:hypothetical protein
MAPTICYLVNRVSTHKAQRDITVEGELTRQEVDQVEVELIDEAGAHGSSTLRFSKPSEMDWARRTFVQGELYHWPLADMPESAEPAN